MFKKNGKSEQIGKPMDSKEVKKKDKNKKKQEK